MGRWGFCLFEGDQDLDLLSDINYDVFGDNLQPDENIKPTNSNLPAEDNDEVGGDRNDLLYADAALCRAKFDSGLGEKLFAQYRAKKNEYLGPYKVIVLGALMIHVGAKISDENLQYLHDLVPEINCNEGHAMPLWDEGFRGPGKRQFLAALAAYKAGVPRNLQTASCFHCGKTKDDTGKTPLACGRCKGASYCDKDCQKAHWRLHKPHCSDPEQRAGQRGFMSLNV